MSTEPEQQRWLWSRTCNADGPHVMKPEDFARCFASDAAPVLNEATRAHLFHAANMLVEQIEDDLHALRTALGRHHDAGAWSELNWTQAYLPPAHAASYNLGFIRQFHWSVLTVVFKLGGDSFELSSLAEELAMNALLRCAITLRELRIDFGEDVADIDFDALWDLAFWDLDFEMLFTPVMDGVQHTAYGRRAGIANLDRSEWFTMFDGAAVPPHPMTW